MMPAMITVAKNDTGMCVICGKRPGELRHTLPAELICPICWGAEVCFMCEREPTNYIETEDGNLYYCCECIEMSEVFYVVDLLFPGATDVMGYEVKDYEGEAISTICMGDGKNNPVCAKYIHGECNGISESELASGECSMVTPDMFRQLRGRKP
jgi:hypothetical protein